MVPAGDGDSCRAKVGILMLESRFPRIPGDVGNAATWRFPVMYTVVRGASPDRVVRRGAEGLLDQFVNAARLLVSEGAAAITTSCGFLSQFQEELAVAVPVPVASSSLMQIALVNRLLPQGRRAGVLTVSGSTLTPEHLRRANAPEDTPVGTTEGGREFTRAILDDEPEMDIGLARRDNIDAALDLRHSHPDLGAIVLECTNMCPFSADIRQATGLPVYSLVTLVNWLQVGLDPPHWGD